jgi:hypothetical protein
MAEAVLMVPQVVVAVQMDLVVELVLMEIVMVLMEEMLVHYLLGLVLAVVVPVKMLKLMMAVLDFSYQPHIMTHLPWLSVVQDQALLGDGLVVAAVVVPVILVPIHLVVLVAVVVVKTLTLHTIYKKSTVWEEPVVEVEVETSTLLQRELVVWVDLVLLSSHTTHKDTS